MSKITAQTIEALLAVKHAKDVFVPQCKNGPTWGTAHLCLDAWAMKRSWANPLVSGYEVKVSRGDFLQDEKWRGYMDYCNAFSFVCTSGLISADELPAEVGLLWVSKTGGRLYTKRKAAWRDVQIPEAFYGYILMSRVEIVKPNHYRQESNEEYWTRWLKTKEDKRELGYRVSKTIREMVTSRIDSVTSENRDLVSKMQDYQAIVEMLKGYGLADEQGNPTSRWDRERKIEELQSAIPERLAPNIESAIVSLTNVQDALREIKNKPVATQGAMI